MVPIAGGTFQMGSTSWEVYSDEQPVHEVTLGNFYMSKYEVTQAQYRWVVGRNPQTNFEGGDRPQEAVTWYDAVGFCNALSESQGLSQAYNDSDWTVNWDASGYRLPTEAEWECACRAGTTTELYSGDMMYPGCIPLDLNMDAIGWYCGNSTSRTHDVGGKHPNAFGLYDMSGNVMEWCNDWYGSYHSSPQTNPRGPEWGACRVIRGGSWDWIWGNAVYCRSAFRHHLSGIPIHPDDRDNNRGFRIVGSRTVIPWE